MKALLIWSSLLAVFVQNALTITQDEDFGFDVAEDFEVEFSSNEGLKKSSWGLRDVIANVGQIFHLTVPKGAFDGKVKSYEVSKKPYKRNSSRVSNSNLFLVSILQQVHLKQNKNKKHLTSNAINTSNLHYGSSKPLNFNIR